MATEYEGTTNDYCLGSITQLENSYILCNDGIDNDDNGTTDYGDFNCSLCTDPDGIYPEPLIGLSISSFAKTQPLAVTNNPAHKVYQDSTSELLGTYSNKEKTAPYTVFNSYNWTGSSSIAITSALLREYSAPTTNSGFFNLM